ncbi:MAG: universal stress protein [Pseudonocardia sp.]|nr:universal stress protein [Pseudonocardia sp.]
MNTQVNRPTVVVGIDGSDSALRAARWGAAEARRRRALLRLVSASGWEADQVAHPALGGA